MSYDVGKIVEVVQEPEAVFLDLELRNFSRSDGEPFQALVRWMPLYHGPGFGDWYLPDVGQDVLCLFPGVGPDGRQDDLDDGVAIGVVSSTSSPPVDGLQGPLSASRRVYKGKSGVAYDEHLQGDLDRRVEGAETTIQVGNVTRSHLADRTQDIQGNESLTVVGTRTEDTTGNVTRSAGADDTLTVQGDRFVHIFGNRDTQVDGNSTGTSTGTISHVFQALRQMLGSAEQHITATILRLGTTSAVNKLVDERFIALFNTHTHPGVGAPNQQAAVGTHTTTITRAD